MKYKQVTHGMQYDVNKTMLREKFHFLTFIFHHNFIFLFLCSLILYNAMMDLSIVTTCGKNVDIDEEIIAIVSISIDSYEFDVFFTKLLCLHE